LINAGDRQKLETLMASNQPMSPPARIYGWLNSQLSVARHYGGMKYQGQCYVIEYSATGQPLVRIDVLAAEVKATAAADKLERAEKRQAAAVAQGVML
jgi:hypothetical protein